MCWKYIVFSNSAQYFGQVKGTDGRKVVEGRDGNFEKIGKLSKKEEIDMKRRRVNNGLSPMR